MRPNPYIIFYLVVMVAVCVIIFALKLAGVVS